MNVTVLLREMTPQEFQVFSEYSIADYAGDLIRNRGISHEDAHRQAKQEFAALLPDGLSTTGNALRVIMNAQDKRPVGMIWSLYEETDGVKHAFVSDFVLSPQERRKGYAAAALAQLERLALAHGCEECRLFIWNGNAAGRALYDKCGYAAYRQESDGVYMSKKLHRQ